MQKNANVKICKLAKINFFYYYYRLARLWKEISGPGIEQFVEPLTDDKKMFLPRDELVDKKGLCHNIDTFSPRAFLISKKSS